MESLQSPRRIGELIFWHLYPNRSCGGFGKVEDFLTKEQYFLNDSMILSGKPIPGSLVTFTPLPPQTGHVNPRASAAVIDNKAAR